MDCWAAVKKSEHLQLPALAFSWSEYIWILFHFQQSLTHIGELTMKQEQGSSFVYKISLPYVRQLSN